MQVFRWKTGSSRRKRSYTKSQLDERRLACRISLAKATVKPRIQDKIARGTVKATPAESKG
jgi:hypothetical protein